jgi:endoglucanase
VADEVKRAGPPSGVSLPLRTARAHIVDGAGRRVKLASVNWYGADGSDHVPGGLTLQPVDAIAREIKSLGFNSVRLTWSNYLLECDPLVDPATVEGANPQYEGRRALYVFDDVVRALAAQGLLVIIDDHSSDPIFNTPGTEDALWYNARYRERQWIADWITMAGRFKGVRAVVGADLRNEPSRDASGVEATWGDGSEHDWRRAAMVAGDAVLRANPDLLVAVEGVGSGGDLSGAVRNPIVLQPDCPPAESGSPQPSTREGCRRVTDKLVYSPHNYYNFQGADVDADYAKLSARLQDQWGRLAQGEAAHPVWVGEFGTCNTSRACVERQPYGQADCLDPGPGGSGLEGAWFENLTRYLAVTDIDWSYWPLNGTPVPNDQRPDQCYGLLDTKWTAPANAYLLCALQAIQQPTSGASHVTEGCGGSSYASAVSADNPLVYYPLDEAAGSVPIDAEHHQNGKIVGRVEQGQPGISAGASDRSIKVAASEGYVEVGGKEALQDDHARTVELWFQTTAQAHQSLFDGGTGSHGRGFVLALADRANEGGAPEQTPGIYLQLWDSDVYIPGLQVTDGAWHYVAVTVDGKEAAIVVDGQARPGYVWNGRTYGSLEHQPFTLPLAPRTAPQQVLLGNARPDAATWAAGFHGSIDDVAIYGRALTLDRLTAHYAAARH